MSLFFKRCEVIALLRIFVYKVENFMRKHKIFVKVQHIGTMLKTKQKNKKLPKFQLLEKPRHVTLIIFLRYNSFLLCLIPMSTLKCEKNYLIWKTWWWQRQFVFLEEVQKPFLAKYPKNILLVFLFKHWKGFEPWKIAFFFHWLKKWFWGKPIIFIFQILVIPH